MRNPHTFECIMPTLLLYCIMTHLSSCGGPVLMRGMVCMPERVETSGTVNKSQQEPWLSFLDAEQRKPPGKCEEPLWLHS